jgi:hypothetical protein
METPWMTGLSTQLSVDLSEMRPAVLQRHRLSSHTTRYANERQTSQTTNRYRRISNSTKLIRCSTALCKLNIRFCVVAARSHDLPHALATGFVILPMPTVGTSRAHFAARLQQGKSISKLWLLYSCHDYLHAPGHCTVHAADRLDACTSGQIGCSAQLLVRRRCLQ